MSYKILLSVLFSPFIIILLFGFYAEGAEKNTKEEASMVSDGKSVKAHYTLTVEGKIIDSSNGKEPFEFQVGSRQTIPGFENSLKGMKVGDKKSFQISPEEGYGQEDPEGIQEVPRDKLPPDINPEAGMTLYAKGSNGQSIPVRIVEVKKEAVVINFNHPLAGKTLNFDVEVIDIK